MRKRWRCTQESKEIEIFEDGKVKAGSWGENHFSSDAPIARPKILLRIEIFRNWKALGWVEVEEAEGEEIKEG